ncbi:MAG: CHAT domain-containing tetratricopeptide repeat protein [Bacteroidia bacterium]|nr:CHAT domain-containing tetratricopeptide repeat protein [Bacteroidia bacterium]
MRLSIILILFYGFSLCGFCQTWKVLDSLCYEYHDSQPDTAIILGKKAIQGCIKEKGRNSVEYAVCLDHIAWAYKNKAKFRVADSLYQEAKYVLEYLQKTETVEYSEIINNLGILKEIQGKYTEAEKLYMQSILLRERLLGKNDLEYATACNNLGNLYLNQDRLSEAELYLKQALSIIEKKVGRKHLYYATIANNLAKIYQVQGKYPEAEILYKSAKEGYEILVGKKHPYYATACNNLAFLYERQGLYTQAEDLYQEALSIRLMTSGKNHPDYAASCNALGGLLYATGRYNQAEIWYQEALSIKLKVFGKQHQEYAGACNNLGFLYSAQQKYHPAETLFKQAQTIYANVLGKNSAYYATACNNLARVYRLQKKYPQAESLFKEALNIYEKLFSKMHTTYIQTCENLSVMYVQQKRYSEAEALFKHIVQTKMQDIETNFKNLSESEKEKYLKANIESAFNTFQNFVFLYYKKNPSITQESYNLILQTKGLILSSTEKVKNRIINSQDELLKTLYLEWKATKDKYTKAQNLNAETRQKRKINIDSLSKRVNELEKELTLKSEDFAHVFSNHSHTWKEVQDKLKPFEAAVEVVKLYRKEFVQDENNEPVLYFALILKKQSKYPELVHIPHGSKLEKEYLINYKRSIKHKIADEISYDIYWKPLKKKLKDIKTVYFSSDGVYHQINISTLYNPDNKKYLCDEVQIINVTSTKDILQNCISTSGVAYLIGNPLYQIHQDTLQGDDVLTELEWRDIEPLEGAEKEVKEASLFLERAITIVGKDATEEYIKSIKNPRILHIATHGYFKKGQYQSSTQAMLNAGLLLAGVVDYDRMKVRPFDKEDGRLTAFEVMNMDLDSTQLVVLSACETALGQASKEGVYGLQRAFKVAGAQRIIMSLWKVNDEATQLLMTKFYENWQKKGISERAAFEIAQREVRNQYREPYYWGAFVMIE